MCRVIAPNAATPTREATSRAPNRPAASLRHMAAVAGRRLVRTAIHRARRWFAAPIGEVRARRAAGYLDEAGPAPDLYVGRPRAAVYELAAIRRTA